MHLTTGITISPIHKHMSSILESDLTGWIEYNSKTETNKSHSINATIKKEAHSFFHRRKSITVQQKRRVLPTTSRYMDASLYPKSPIKKPALKPRPCDISYSFIRKKSISQLSKLMKILETRTISQSVDLPKLHKPSMAKAGKAEELKSKPSKIFSNTLMKFYKA